MNQRVDATHVVSHVNRISTTDLLFRTVRCVVEEIEKKEDRQAETIFEENVEIKKLHQIRLFTK